MSRHVGAKALTADYDRWLARQITVVRADVARKHAELRADRFRFLRGTYYLWLARVVERVPEVLGTARVPLVGDLHVENFGTWRDQRQVRRWGVNDLDELGTGPWLLDLLRLAVSVTQAPHIALDDATACDTLLRAYATTPVGADVALANPRAEHLRALVPPFASPDTYYDGLAGGHPEADLPAEVVAAAEAVAEPGWRPTWHAHEAGTGSLGHRRRAGVGPAADGTRHAREAKQLGPGTLAWAAPLDARLPQPDDGLYARVLAAVKGPAAATRVLDWQVRDLAPDIVRIELSGLRPKDAELLLGSMARAAADVHAADEDAWKAARTEALGLDRAHFRRLVATMAEVVKADFRAYGD
ncbi:MAG TPA: DUF2252 family protein [Cellulomonas sp.]